MTIIIADELLEVFDVEPGHAAVDLPLAHARALELHVRTPEAARGGTLRAWLVADDDSWSHRLELALA